MLSVIVSVPPQKPKVFDERGQEVQLKLGPYKVGDTVILKCVASGGNETIIGHLQVKTLS